MKGGGAIRSGGGGGGGGLMRTRLRLPVVLISCSLFFLAGFFGSLLFTQVTLPVVALAVTLSDSSSRARASDLGRLFRGRIRRGRRTWSGRCGGSG